MSLVETGYEHIVLDEAYWDHKDELDQDIARRRARVDELRRTTPLSPIKQS